MINNNYTTIPTDGLVLDLPLDGNANARVGSNWTATNVVWVASEKWYTSEVGSFNGSSSYVNMWNTTLSASLLVINVYVKLSADTWWQQWIISQESWTLASTNSFYLRWFRSTSTTWYWNFWYRTTSWTFAETGDTTPIAIPIWQRVNLLAIQDTAWWELKLYVNWVQSWSTTAITLNRSNNTTNLRIGQRAGWSWSNVNWLIWLVKIYDNTLTQNDKNNLYQEWLRRLGPLQSKLSNWFKAYSTNRLENWKILEISKAQSWWVYYDQTGNGNNSTSIVNVTDSADGIYNVMNITWSISWNTITITSSYCWELTWWDWVFQKNPAYITSTWITGPRTLSNVVIYNRVLSLQEEYELFFSTFIPN